jgi:UDP-N-acetylglucosamine 2-epimerase (non-hydrolysing)
VKLAVVLGTRPEIIKMSSTIRECASRGLDYFVVDTGQHYDHELSRVFFETLQLPPPRYQLHVGSGTHGQQTGRLLMETEQVLIAERPDTVLVQGDTNTVLAGALAASKLGIRVGHVEAGLRSLDRTMPEETNRILTDHLSDMLFAPTPEAVENLIEEGIPVGMIFMTGNTIVDALVQHLEIARKESRILNHFHLSKQQYLLSTVHRPENVDCRDRLVAILQSFAVVCSRFGLPLIIPMHPRTRKMLHAFDLGMPAQVLAVEPMGYLDFLQLQSNAAMILTDSGGVQEEACILRVPCVTLRNNTERPETVRVGANMVAGVQPEMVVTCAERMYSVPRDWPNPFGDGRSFCRILDAVQAADSVALGSA